LKKLESQKKILEELYKSRFFTNTPYLSTNSIISGTNLPGPTVKGVLANLVKIRWIEKRSLISATNVRNRKLRQELVKITIKDKDNFVNWIPVDIFDEFETKLTKLERKKKYLNFQKEVITTSETYAKVLKSMDVRKSKRIQKEHNLSFKGRTRLVKSIKNWTKARRKNFYKILVYPYIIDDRVGGHTKLSTKQLLQNRWNDVPKKHEVFWKNTVSELRKYNFRV
jgi:hypothetical protein